MGHVWLAASIWMGLGLLASLLSIWTGVSVALVEILVGAIAANVVGLVPSPWVDHLAGLGAIMLAFLAGTEVRWAVVRRRALANLTIGAASFVAPFLDQRFQSSNHIMRPCRACRSRCERRDRR
jgi:Kef-type K+ transport system membrane component KefB